MLPIVTALEKTLSGKWSWQRLLEMGGAPGQHARAGELK
jgi:hypothetical protein